MPIELWLAFALASTALLTVPGPTVMLVVSYALGQGRGSAWATVPGVALGDFTAMTVSLLGAGAVLAASATLFAVLKYAGAAYLIWLGIKLWRAEPSIEGLNGGRQDAGRGAARGAMFRNAYVVTALNPKSVVFFTAFVPQFIAAERTLIPQLVILEATFLTLAAISAALWAILAGEMRARFHRPETVRLANRIGGGVMIGAGLLTAAARRA